MEYSRMANVLSPDFEERFKRATAASRGIFYCPECDEQLVKHGPGGAEVYVCPKCWKQPAHYTNLPFEAWEAEKMRDPDFRNAAQQLEAEYELERAVIRYRIEHGRLKCLRHVWRSLFGWG